MKSIIFVRPTVGSVGRVMRLGLVFALAVMAVAAQSRVIGLKSRQYIDNNSMTDQTWFYKDSTGAPKLDGGGVYPKPEFLSGRSWQVPAVTYRRGSHLKVTLVLLNYSMTPMSGTIRINQARIVRAGTPEDLIWDLSLVGSPPTVSLPGGTLVYNPPMATIVPSETPVTLEFEGLPNTVQMGQIQMNIDLVRNNSVIWSTTDTTTNWETLYTTYDTPLTGTMPAPWAEVLCDGVLWAGGDDTAQDVVDHCTADLYSFNTFNYVGGAQWLEGNRYGGVFKLKPMLVARSSGTPSGNCTDVSNYLYLVLQAQGVASAPEVQMDDEAVGFRTWPLRPIGGSAFAETDWIYHAIVLYDSEVYDACLSLQTDLSGNENYGQPIGWNATGYWQTCVSGVPTYGLVKAYEGGVEPVLVGRSTGGVSLTGVL